ncbi:MAG: hypothetical protein ACRDI2_08505, partial [Chloroflexota bacterium]
IEEEILQETGNRLERVIVLAENGRVLLAKTGDVGEVGFTVAELEELRGVADLLTHNHPSEGGIGIADFDVATLLNVREINAFGRRYRYRLIRTGRTWPDLQPALAFLSPIRRRVERRLRARVAAGTLSPGEASLNYWHEVWVEFAKPSPDVLYFREVRQT